AERKGAIKSVAIHLPRFANASHIGKAAGHARHGIVRMNFILEINETPIPHGKKGFKDLPHRHDPFPHDDLTILALEISEVLHVHVKQAGACFADRPNHIRAGTSGMPDIDATPDAWIHVLYRI